MDIGSREEVLICTRNFSGSAKVPDIQLTKTVAANIQLLCEG